MDEEYDYDQSGNLTSLTDHLNGNNDQVFTYDDFHRLEEFNAPNLWGAGSYGYENVCLGRREYENINGSITNYVYNNTTKRLDYTTGVCACDFNYDANGNIRSITGHKALTIKIDYENRPVSIANRITGDRVDCVYDGKGERVKRIAPYPKQGGDVENPDSRSTPCYYMHAPWGGVLYECRMFASGPSDVNYAYLNGRLLAKFDNGGFIAFYHTDYLGTPKAMTDNTQTKLYEWLGYPFGKEYASIGWYMNNYRFTGKEFDELTGLYYYGARYYFPDFGIFIEPEPFMGTNGLNLADPLSLKFYDYCRNNPLRFIDPDGRRAMTPREVEIARQIMVKAEQSYFREKSRAYDEVRYTGGSWPEDIAADRIEPVSLEGLPGELSLKFMLKLRGEQLLSILSRGAYSPETEPLLEKVLWSIGTNEKIRVDLQLRKDLQKIYKIVYTKRTDQKYDIFYLGENDNITVIYRTLSPQAFEDWLKQIEGYKGE
jgi:RHS repeat-associated protein